MNESKPPVIAEPSSFLKRWATTFKLMCVAVLILRKRRPEAPRKFVMPFAWIVAPLGILGCFWIARGLPALTWYRFFAWLAIGLVIYFFFGSRNSRLAAPTASS